MPGRPLPTPDGPPSGRRPRARLVAVVALAAGVALAVVLVVVLVVVRPGGGDDDVPTDAVPAQVGRVSEALEVLPSDATSLVFVDRQALADDVGVDRTTPPDAYAAALRSPLGRAVRGTDLLGSLRAMDAGGAAYDERDVEWAATAGTPEGSITVHRVADDVDLDGLVLDLSASGLAATDVGGDRTRLSPGPLSPAAVTTAGALGGYPPSFRDVLVDPVRHLVVTGSRELLDREPAVLDGGEGLTDDRLLDEAVGAETGDTVMVLAQAPPACTGERARAARERAEAQVGLGLEGLGVPEATAVLVDAGGAPSGGSSGAGGPGVRARLVFASTDAAAADLAARRGYVAGGRYAAAQAPVRDLGTAVLRQEGRVVDLDLDLVDPGTVRDLASTGDGFLACPG
ncbi:hypothetical protein [Nocardioides litoris]|uniref:hypothetical protein n=1 Tax=Nocardioides litoris TaxID=1926648 RepID=UPI00111D6895|nr:hypothetical protein [Nocardioides litoris]